MCRSNLSSSVWSSSLSLITRRSSELGVAGASAGPNLLDGRVRNDLCKPEEGIDIKGLHSGKHETRILSNMHRIHTARVRMHIELMHWSGFFHTDLFWTEIGGISSVEAWVVMYLTVDSVTSSKKLNYHSLNPNLSLWKLNSAWKSFMIQTQIGRADNLTCSSNSRL